MSFYFFIFSLSFLSGIFLGLKTLAPFIIISFILFLALKESNQKIFPLIIVIILSFSGGFLRVKLEKKLDKIELPQKVFIVNKNNNLYITNKGVALVSKEKIYPGYEIILKDEAQKINEEFLNKRGIYYISFLKNSEIVEKKNILTYIFKFKEIINSFIDENLSFDSAQILKGIILGQKPIEEIEEIFKKSGLLHILVVSGQNLTLSCFILINLFKKLIKRKFILFFSIIFILFLAVMISESATWRAALMVSLVLLFEILGRPVLVRNIILIVIIILTLIKPSFILDISFQLSILAILGLFYFKKSIENFMPKIFKEKNILAEILGVQIFILPFLLYQFSYFSLSGIFANLLILPIFPILFLSQLLLLPFIFFFPIKILAEFIINLFYFAVKFFSLLEIKINVFLPEIIVFMCYFIFALIILRNKNIPDFTWKI